MILYAYQDRTGMISLWEHTGKELTGAGVLGTIEVTEPDTPKTATLTLAGMDDLIRQVSKLSQLAQRFEDGIQVVMANLPFCPETTQPKKTVTKEAEDRGPTGQGDRSGYIGQFFIPANAKNIKCTYEVEE